MSFKVPPCRVMMREGLSFISIDDLIHVFNSRIATNKAFLTRAAKDELNGAIATLTGYKKAAIDLFTEKETEHADEVPVVQ